jgi:hypothetical protein
MFMIFAMAGPIPSRKPAGMGLNAAKSMPSCQRTRQRVLSGAIFVPL